MSRAYATEMTFVLLARDATAPQVIRFWCDLRIALGKNNQGDDQIQEALACADAMESDYKNYQIAREPGSQAPRFPMCPADDYIISVKELNSLVAYQNLGATKRIPGTHVDKHGHVMVDLRYEVCTFSKPAIAW